MDQREWEAQKASFHIGEVVTGKVVRQEPFGVFVALDVNAIGLIEVPDLSPDRVLSASSYPNVGDLVEAQVIGFRERNRQIALSVKAVRIASDEADT